MEDRFFAGYEGDSFYLADYYSNPSKSEISAFSSSSYGELRFCELEGVIFFTLKLGSLPWQDASFTPHWYDPKPFVIAPPSHGNGFMCQLTLIDTQTKHVCAHRVVGLGHEFSMKLFDAVSANYQKPFNLDSFLKSVSSVCSRYSSEEIAQRCPPEQRYVFGTHDTVSIPTIDADESIPEELRRWITYPADSNHTQCVSSVPKMLLERYPDTDLSRLTVPIPTRYVLEKGYSLTESGYVIVDAPYDRIFGISIPDEYYD